MLLAIIIIQPPLNYTHEKLSQYYIFLCLLLSFYVLANDEFPVAITAEIPLIEASHRRLKLTLKRIQDTNNNLVDDFAKSSRPCPPFYIHPMLAAADV